MFSVVHVVLAKSVSLSKMSFYQKSAVVYLERWHAKDQSKSSLSFPQ